MSYQPNPSARDPSFNETNPRRDELRAARLHNRPWVYAVVPIAVVAVTIAVLWWAGQDRPDFMPRVVGLPLSPAIDQIEAAGGCLSEVSIHRAEDGDIVTAQQPPADQRLGGGLTEVRLEVGSGTRVRTVMIDQADALCPGTRPGVGS